MIFIPREEEKQESNLLVLIPAEDKIRMMPLVESRDASSLSLHVGIGEEEEALINAS